MDEKKKVSVLDVTIRDGSYAINYTYAPDQVEKIVAALDDAGVDLIEIGHGCGLGAGENIGLTAAASDAEYVLAARKAARRAKIGVIAGPAPITLPKDINTIIDHVDFIRFFSPFSKLRSLEANIRHVHSIRGDLPLFLQATMSSRATLEALLDACKYAESLQIATLYVVDTAGYFIPEALEELIAELVAASNVSIGFHGHNNLGLAIANSLAAIRGGATSIDASLRGIGRAGGNAQLEALIPLIQRMGVAKTIDALKLLNAGEELVKPLMPDQRGIEAVDILTASVNISIYPVGLFQIIAREAGIEFEKLIHALGSDPALVEVDIPAIRHALESLGVDSAAILKKIGIDDK
ncbi:MAG: hypothetical protein WC956_07215 [bacterium]